MSIQLAARLRHIVDPFNRDSPERAVALTAYSSPLAMNGCICALSGGDRAKMPTRGERIVEAMKLRGTTKQHALASALGVNESTITRWKANGPMSVNSAVLLCKELDISLDWFLNGTGSMDSHKLNVQMPSITQDKLLAHFQRFEATLSDHSKSLLIAFMDSLLPKQREE